MFKATVECLISRCHVLRSCSQRAVWTANKPMTWVRVPLQANHSSVIGRSSFSTKQTGSKTKLRSWQKGSGGSLESPPYILLFIPACALGLAIWQVQRRDWKLNLIDELEQKTRAFPVDFPQDLDELQLKDMEFRKVQVRGKFDHSKELHIRPRMLLKEEGAGGSGTISAGRVKSGAQVVTPFHLSDRNVIILVNRGWVPENKINPQARLEGQVEGEVELTGVVRHTEKRPQFELKNNPVRNEWHFRDIEEMSMIADTHPIFIDADAKSTVPGGPIGGQTRVTLRNEHLSYIITWASLSAITSFMWYKRYMVK